MTKLFHIFNAVILALLVAVAWGGLAELARWDNAVFLPNAVRFATAAGVLFLLQLVVDRRLPQVSLKLFQSSVSLGAIAYFLPAVIYFYSLRQMPSSLIAVALAPVPIYLLLFWPVGIWGNSWHKYAYLAIFTLGLLVFYQSTRGWGMYSKAEIIYLCLLGFTAFLTATALALTRRLFWLHSAVDLNIWALLFAAIFFFILGFLSGEPYWDWDRRYWIAAIGLGAGVTGLGTFLYRYFTATAMFWPSFFLAILIPLGSVAVGIWLVQDTVFNLYTIFGSVLTVLPFFLGRKSEHPHVWLVHYFANTRRLGDRVACSLEGFVKTQSQITLKIRVNDLSIGGLGFICEEAIPVGEHVVVTLPVQGTGWTQLSIDCQLVHGSRNGTPPFPFSGGLAFQKLSSDARQTLVEFLAKLGQPELN